MGSWQLVLSKTGCRVVQFSEEFSFKACLFCLQTGCKNSSHPNSFITFFPCTCDLSENRTSFLQSVHFFFLFFLQRIISIKQNYNPGNHMCKAHTSPFKPNLSTLHPKQDVSGKTFHTALSCNCALQAEVWKKEEKKR